MKKLLIFAATIVISAIVIYLIFAIAVDHGGSGSAGASESRLPTCYSYQEPHRFEHVRPEQVAVCTGGSGFGSR